jgi:hypothetical protein
MMHSPTNLQKLILIYPSQNHIRERYRSHAGTEVLRMTASTLDSDTYLYWSP